MTDAFTPDAAVQVCGLSAVGMIDWLGWPALPGIGPGLKHQEDPMLCRMVASTAQVIRMNSRDYLLIEETPTQDRSRI